MILLTSATNEATLLVTKIVELGHQTNDTTVGIKSLEAITIKVNRPLKNLHLNCTRSIAIAKTIGDLIEAILDLVHRVVGGVVVFHNSTTLVFNDAGVKIKFPQQSKKVVFRPPSYTHQRYTMLYFNIVRHYGTLYSGRHYCPAFP